MMPRTEKSRIWLVAMGYWLVASLVFCLFYPVFISDTMARYAPMVDAFARGDWANAFHPRFGVLFQVVAGSLVWCFGLSGEHAMQIVSTLTLALSSVPVFFLVRRLFDVRIAWWTVVLLLVADDFTRYAMDGLRDSGKCLAFALIGFAAVERKSGWFACGLFVLVTTVSYGFASASVFLLIWTIASLVRRDWRNLVWPMLGWSLGTAAVVVMTHAFTGHWLPSPHYIRFLGGWL